MSWLNNDVQTKIRDIQEGMGSVFPQNIRVQNLLTKPAKIGIANHRRTISSGDQISVDVPSLSTRKRSESIAMTERC